jgi:hypothetical protein
MAALIAPLILDIGATMMPDGIIQIKDKLEYEITDKSVPKAALDIVQQNWKIPSGAMPGATVKIKRNSSGSFRIISAQQKT